MFDFLQNLGKCMLHETLLTFILFDCLKILLFTLSKHLEYILSLLLSSLAELTSNPRQLIWMR